MEEKEKAENETEEVCGSHYGAGEDGECCNTCDDVKRAYSRKGWQMPSLVNVSHMVRKLRFSAEYPGNVNQLDGEVRNIADGYGMYQYYFQVRR